MPVSIHYFLRDGKMLRRFPDAVKAESSRQGGAAAAVREPSRDSAGYRLGFWLGSGSRK